MNLNDSITEATDSLLKIRQRSAKILVIIDTELARMTIVSGLRALGFSDITTLSHQKILKREEDYDWVISNANIKGSISVLHMMHTANNSMNKKGMLFSVLISNKDEMPYMPPMFDMGMLSWHYIDGFSRQVFDSAIGELLKLADVLKNDQLVAAAYYFKMTATDHEKKYLSKSNDINLLLGDKFDMLIEMRKLFALAFLKEGKKEDYLRLLSPDNALVQAVNNKALTEAGLGKHDEAIQRLKKLSAEVPKSKLFTYALVQYNLALAYVRAGKCDDALEALQSGIAVGADALAGGNETLKKFIGRMDTLYLKIVEAKNNNKPLNINSKTIDFEPANKRPLSTWKEKFPNKCLSPVMFLLNTTPDELIVKKTTEVMKYTAAILGSI